MIRLDAPRAVLFDVGDTLLEEQRFDLEAGLAAVVPDQDTVKALAIAFRAELAECYRRNSELRLAAWVRDRLPALQLLSIAEIEDAIWASVVTLGPRLGVAKVLRRLADDRLPIAAVSNASFSGRVLSAELARYGLADPLRFVMSSADTGTRKPGKAIFQAALDRLGVTAQQTWFVGDTLDEDITGAIEVGLQPIWFSNGKPARQDFNDLHTVKDWAEFMELYEAASHETLE
jgi:FMN phosphatase YigB (HAD superfamily)